MSWETQAVIGYFNEGEMCVVCGKRVHPGETLATRSQSGCKLPICCSVCLRAYEKDCTLYLTRLAERIWLDELGRLGVGP